ncbi:unnamed protein product [Prunus armeniaca]
MLQVATKRAKESMLEQNVFQLRELPIRELVIALLVNFDTHVKATKVSKHEITANAYKLGYLDCKNGAPPCCPLEHADEVVKDQVADEAAMEEDNAKSGAADEVRAYAGAQAARAAKYMVPVDQNEAVAKAVDQELAEDVIG